MKYTIEHSKRPTDIHQHLLMLYGLVTSIKAKIVIELGVNTGESTVAILEAVAATGGKLYSVDIIPRPATEAMLKSYGLTGPWEFTVANDLEYIKTWPKDRMADLIFIDTSHEYEQTRKEIEVYEPILRPGGIMVFHDTVSFYDGVQKPINEFLKTRKHWPYENRTHCNGLGILRKPT